MPVNYGILRGSIVNALPYQEGADHYQIEVNASNNIYRIAVDVYSQIKGEQRHYSTHGSNLLDTDRMVMYYKDENYNHPILNTILQCAEGFTPKKDLNKLLWLDYIRYTPLLFPLDQMKVVPPKDENNYTENLNQDIDPWIQKAMNNPNAEIFALGSGWDDNAAGSKPDTNQYFNPEPSMGIHDIHMNQGDTGYEAKYNGTWQDGGLFIHFIKEAKWIAMFFRFQNQSINTNNNNGNLI